MTFTVATKENDVWTSRKTFANKEEATQYAGWLNSFYNETTKIIEF